ncbi:MAG TPA: PQQ-binding-like beta-propeller repeat protein [Fimbriimonadaceae bacterium]|jgi:outer membrane protein assembly factor BamB
MLPVKFSHGRGWTKRLATDVNTAFQVGAFVILQSNSKILALEARTGRQIWSVNARVPDSRDYYAIGQIRSNWNGLLELAINDDPHGDTFALRAYQVQTGRLLWEAPVSSINQSILEKWPALGAIARDGSLLVDANDDQPLDLDIKTGRARPSSSLSKDAAGLIALGSHVYRDGREVRFGVPWDGSFTENISPD